MSGLASRLLVAVPGLAVVLGAAYLGGWLLFALALAAALVALHELYRLARSLRPLVLAGYAGAAGTLVAAHLARPAWMVGALFATLVLAFLFAAVAETRQSTTVAIGTTQLGAAWVGLGLGCLLLVRDIDAAGREPIFAVLLAVFVNDTFAYAGGRLAGRHRMTPVLSPGKTWEGLVTGAAAGIVTTWIVFYETPYLPGWRSFALGAVIVLAATIGDLFESLVKRDVGAKDTGRILAGHGGMLDRIDSLLFAGPAAYFALLALGPV